MLFILIEYKILIGSQHEKLYKIGIHLAVKYKSKVGIQDIHKKQTKFNHI